MLWLDIRRGFCSKRFWGIVGVVTIVFVVFLTLDIIYPLQKYYNGYGTFDWKLTQSRWLHLLFVSVFYQWICLSLFSIYWSNSICWNDNRWAKRRILLSDYTKRGFHSYYWVILSQVGCLGTSCGSYSYKLISVDRHWDRTKSIMERCNTSVSYTRIWIGKRDGLFWHPYSYKISRTRWTCIVGNGQLLFDGMFVWVIRSDNCICIRCTGSCICNANDHYGDRVWGLYAISCCLEEILLPQMCWHIFIT